MEILNKAGLEDLIDGGRDWQPSVDVNETPEAFYIRAELPGVRKEDVEVSCRESVLTLKGHKSPSRPGRKQTRHRAECIYGGFKRSFALPETIDPESIEADLRNGVLVLSVPKSGNQPAGTNWIEITNGTK